MPRLSPMHLDDFTLLRYVAQDLGPDDLEQVERHLAACRACADVAQEIRKLDRELAEAAADGAFESEAAVAELPEADPFRRRPISRRSSPRSPAPTLAKVALDASEAAGPLRDEILAAAFEGVRIAERLGELPLSDPAGRFALLYALQEGGRRIAESPVRMLAFAEAALSRLTTRDERDGEADRSPAEAIAPRSLLIGQAHLLAGQACSWTGDLDRAGSHLELAYRCFGREGGDEIGLATVEHLESQRRSFLKRGEEALILARRAAATFESFGLEDLLARARAAMGIALDSLGRYEEAAEAFRSTVPFFEERGLWSNAINSLNNLAVVLQKLGRLDEARREYARALRRFSRGERQSLAFIRHGLAEVLFSAGHYREAALSLSQAVRLYAAEGMRARSLTAALLEIESWAKSGDLARARHRLELLRLEVERSRTLDPAVVRQIRDALAGVDPAYERLAELRKTAEETLRGQLENASA